MRTPQILILDLCVLLLLCAGTYRIALRAGLPFEVEQRNGVLVTSLTGTDQPNTIRSIDGVSLTDPKQIDVITDGHAIGDVVSIYDSAGVTGWSVKLVKRYSVWYLLLQSVSGLIFFSLGLLVLLKLPTERAARAFHHLSVSLAAVICLSTGRFTITPIGLGYVLEGVFHLFYLLAPVCFLAFTLLFPVARPAKLRRTIILASAGIGIALFAFDCYALMRLFVPSLDPAQWSAAHTSENLIRLFFTVNFLAGLGVLWNSYRHAGTTEERHKLRWIFFGIAFGSLSFILLYQVPMMLFSTPFIPEAAVLVFSVVAPISFAIAIVRYRAFNIDLLIKRTTIYAIVIATVFCLYLGIVAVTTNVLFVEAGTSAWPSVVAALVIAFVFEPIRRRVQRRADAVFFRTEFDHHAAERALAEQLSTIHDKTALAHTLIEFLDTLIPVERIACFELRQAPSRLHMLAHRNILLLEGRGVAFHAEFLRSELDRPVIRQGSAPEATGVEWADDRVFDRWGIAAAFPLRHEQGLVVGFLVLGARRSGVPFSSADIEFFQAASVLASAALTRIRLHDQLIVEQAESERLAELDRLKTYFVASVSHDLKTPLTSIAMFAELLRTTESPDQRQEYLDIVEGESNRLARMITTVLSFGQIEQGRKTYRMVSVDLNEVLRQVLALLRYQFSMAGFEILTRLPDAPLVVSADRDALIDVFVNLLSNAMKYSASNKTIELTAVRRGDHAVVTIRDHGVGIPADSLAHVFDPFYRVDRSGPVAGAGLGLSIVKHAIDAHGGSVVIESEVGSGTTVTIALPVIGTA